MLTRVNQRWRKRKGSFRPAHETINTAAYHVEIVTADKIAKDFVINHHYSGSYPAARFRYGLFHQSNLCGIAVFSVPCNNLVITSVFPGDPNDGVELGRFVLLDEVPANGESFFLARAFELLRKEGIKGVISFSDPVPRKNGRVRRSSRGTSVTCIKRRTPFISAREQDGR